ncbi:putative EH domain, EF-hand domain pair protein [Plasmopara halstedii]
MLRSQLSQSTVMTSASEKLQAGSTPTHARDLHRKLLERVLLRSDTKSVKDVFRRYDRERAGVLTLQQFRALVRDHDFSDTDADLLLHHLDVQEQSVSFHAFMGEELLSVEQNYSSRKSNSPKKVQQLAQFPEQKKVLSNKKANKVAVHSDTLAVQDPMEAIRTKLRQRVMGHDKSIREIFMEYDSDGSGFLDYEEFDRFMAKYGFAPSETKIIIDYLDRDHSGTVDYDEFASGLLFYRPPLPISIAPAQTVALPLSLTTIENAQKMQRQIGLDLSRRDDKKICKEADIQQILETVQNKFKDVFRRSKQPTDGFVELRAEFDRFDVDGSKSLDHQEFGALLIGIGIKLKVAELSALLQVIDPDGEEKIQFYTIKRLLCFQEPSNRGLEQQQSGPMKFDSENIVKSANYVCEGVEEQEKDRLRRLQYENSVGIDRKINIMNENLDGDKRAVTNYSRFAQEFSDQVEPSVDLPPRSQAFNGLYNFHENGKADLNDIRQHLNGYDSKKIDAVDSLHVQTKFDENGAISLQEATHGFAQTEKPSPTPDSDEVAISKKLKDYLGQAKLNEFGRMMQGSTNNINGRTEDKDDINSGSFEESTRVYDLSRGSAHKTTSLRQSPDRRTEGIGLDDSRLDKKMRQTLQVSPNINKMGRLAAQQDQEMQFMERVLERHHSIESAFREFDPDVQNKLNFEQVGAFMARYGMTDKEHISMLLKRLDINNSGTIKLQDFLSVFDVRRLALIEGESTRHEEKNLKGLAQNEGKITKSGARDGKYQKNGENRVSPHVIKRGAKLGTTSNPSASDTKATNRSANVARLRKLEEKWIRRALARHELLSSVFDIADHDKDGKITRDEFRKLMNLYGVQDEEDVVALMKKLGVDGDGCINYKDFAKTFNETRVANFTASTPEVIISPTASPIDTKHAQGARLQGLQIKWIKRVLSCHDSIESAFYQYDKDGSGELNHEEFHYFMTRYGIVRNEDISALIRRLDTDGSGTISLKEFSLIFNSLRVSSGMTNEGMRTIAAGLEEITDPEEIESILEIERELAQRMAHQTRDLRLAFRKIDTNGNGLLEYKEFRTVLKLYRLPEMEIRKVIRHLDRNVSGFIDYKQFVAGFSAFKENGSSVPAAQKKKVKLRSPQKG